jgi:hypothetical protein
MADQVQARAMLAPILRAAAIEVAASPKAGGATRLAAIREADAIGAREAASVRGAPSTGLPLGRDLAAGERGRDARAGDGQGFAERMAELRARRQRALGTARGIGADVAAGPDVAETARPGDADAPGVDVPRAGDA